MIFAEELMNSVKTTWDEMVEHPFVMGMAKGTLEKEKFLRYLVQDTIYLKFYAKVYAWGMIKTDDTDLMRKLYRDMDVIISDETMMHIRYLKDLGLTEEETLAQPMHPVTKAYLDYMLTTSEQCSLAEGLVGLMPCAFSYYYIATRCKENAIANGTYEDNYYKEWMDHYSGGSYKACYERTIDICESVVRGLGEAEKARLMEVFHKGTDYEFDFWDMGYSG